jgi:hypothetical protein
LTSLRKLAPFPMRRMASALLLWMPSTSLLKSGLSTGKLGQKSNLPWKGRKHQKNSRLCYVSPSA